ncbi:MAG: hypothetical protein KKB51_22410 [Candidatus Riflebacteria bacterium]|nr:hypothetical protein [Candidatus Riflebacteria bacterium]
MKKVLFVFALLFITSFGQVSDVAGETIQLKHDFLPSNSSITEKHIGAAIAKVQGLDKTLKVFIATEKDVIRKLKSYDEKSAEKLKEIETVEYVASECPMLFILHGFSGNGADDMRGMKISKANFRKYFYVDSIDTASNIIEIEVEKPATIWLPSGSAIGTSDVRYINSRVFFGRLATGTYDIDCFLKTIHIETSNSRKDATSDKITKIERTPLRRFQLILK